MIASIDAIPRSTLNGTFTVFCDSGSSTDFCTMSPGVSRVPANALPSITVSPPNSSASTIAPSRLDAAVGDDRHPPGRLAEARAGLDQRLHLRHAEARGEARGAAAARADADLDRVDAAIGEKAGALGGRDVAGDQLGVREALPELFERPLHDHRMAVGDVDHDHVGARGQQFGCALEVVAGRADRRAHAQPALDVARGERQPLLLEDVLRRDEPDSRPSRSTSGSFLTLRSTIRSLGLGQRDRSFVQDQPIGGRHPVRHGACALDEPDVALGQQPAQAAVAVDDDERADARPAHRVGRLGQRGLRGRSCTGRG